MGIQRREAFDEGSLWAGASMAITSLVLAMALFFAHENGGEWYRYAMIVTFAAVSAYAGWLEWKLRFGFHLLRFPTALWFVLLPLVGFGGRTHTSVVSFERILISDIPFLAIALYSWIQFRKPDGRQLDLPKSWVHAYQRLGWKWLTRPKRDYWVVWIGLLFSPIIGGYFIFMQWHLADGIFWLTALKALWFVSLTIFAFLWVKAPGQREKYREMVVAAGYSRILGILYGFFLGRHEKGLWSDIWAFLIFAAATSIFEDSYDRCCIRQTATSHAEYEALEGPSIGL